jgi:enolase
LPRISNRMKKHWRSSWRGSSRQGIGRGTDIFLALDPAASGFYKEGTYLLRNESKPNRSAKEMVDYYQHLVDKYPIVSLQDGMAEDDWAGWQKLSDQMRGKYSSCRR